MVTEGNRQQESRSVLVVQGNQKRCRLQAVRYWKGVDEAGQPPVKQACAPWQDFPTPASPCRRVSPRRRREPGAGKQPDVTGVFDSITEMVDKTVN